MLSDDKFLRTDFITNIERIEPSTTVFNTALGITIYETEQATAGTVLGFNSRRGGRFTVKTRPRTQRFDLGEGGGPLQKGVTAWELIDAVVTRGDTSRSVRCDPHASPGPPARPNRMRSSAGSTAWPTRPSGWPGGCGILPGVPLHERRGISRGPSGRTPDNRMRPRDPIGQAGALFSWCSLPTEGTGRGPRPADSTLNPS